MDNLYTNIQTKFTIIHGPCAIESEEMLEQIVVELKDISSIFRGGAYKPRTSPDTFQGLKRQGMEVIKKIKENHNINIVTEITSEEEIDMYENVDIIQIGARNMQNFELIKKVARLNKPIILKRGFANTVEELISSAKYIENEGNNQIILCERGIRTFSNVSRFTLDLSAVGYLKDNYPYPVLIDPSHAGGYQEEVKRLTRAACAYGCDGLLIEVHPSPEDALSDKLQQLSIQEYRKLVKELKI